MLASKTLAHIHLEGQVDEVFASTEDALRGAHRRGHPADGRVGR
jgi:hypothetical protein